MAINTRNDELGRNGGRMPLASEDGGASPWSRRCPNNEYPGARRYTGPDLPKRPVGGTPEGNPSKTPRP